MGITPVNNTFEETIKRYYPHSHRELLAYLKKYEMNIKFNVKDNTPFNTNKHFFNLPCDYWFGPLLKFLNLNGIEITIDFFEKFSDGEKFNAAIEAVLIEHFIKLEYNLSKKNKKPL